MIYLSILADWSQQMYSIKGQIVHTLGIVGTESLSQLI